MDVFATETTAREEQFVTISESAVKRLSEIFQSKNKPNLMLRVSVSGGGCSGFQYGFDFAESENADDQIFERDGVKIVIDNLSLGYLTGSEIDFVTEMVGSSFQVNNPNAASGCGCGASFSL